MSQLSRGQKRRLMHKTEVRLEWHFLGCTCPGAAIGLEADLSRAPNTTLELPGHSIRFFPHDGLIRLRTSAQLFRQVLWQSEGSIL